MPALHLAPRFLSGASSGGISPTAIAVLIVVGVIPVVALIWVCVWLLFFYSSGRNCCCMQRRKGGSGNSSTSTETLDVNEKGDVGIQRPVPAWSDSDSSQGKGKRGSGLSRWSSGSGVVVQEPKSMV